ncbi:YlzJ-like family protein [Paenibacillus aestuarii]|uniref:YlzJ-like family protein n=1 Tax=Paenibacillus aestuarii TaxID=516965 RepID=A0ABW0K5V5_9BACL|nr:YlzJ-like family protein [Paenibacillus aestuarii]
MIHYSIVPLEDIYQGMDSFAPNYMEITVQGVTMQVEPVGGFQARIVRLHSCNPQDYLNTRYAPGTMITYSPDLSVT